MRAAARVLATGLAGPRPSRTAAAAPATPVRRGAGEECHDNAVMSSRRSAAELAARTPAIPDAQSVEDLTALLTSAGSAEVETVTAPGLRRGCHRPLVEDRISAYLGVFDFTLCAQDTAWLSRMMEAAGIEPASSQALQP
jgi:hypothetical protein